MIADDHKVFRQGIASILEFVEDIKIIAEAANVQTIKELVPLVTPDVILMDIALGNSSGIDATKWVKENFSQVNILVLSMYAENAYIIEMLEAGASGYLLKDTGKEELFTAIRTVAKGDSYYSKHVSNTLIEHLKEKRLGTIKPKKDIPLTRREVEVLKLIVAECSNAEIAQQLFISIRTVDTHKRNLLEKLKVKNTAGLVKYAIKNNLVES